LNNEIIGASQSLDVIKYAFKARNGRTYDFKERGIAERGYQSREQYRYRGMPLNDVKEVVSNDGNGKIAFGSARDVGNVGAGFVAGRNGLIWDEARLGFDAYQSWSQSKFFSLFPRIVLTTEGQPTQRAELVRLESRLCCLLES
jgi:hypothetical protein